MRRLNLDFHATPGRPWVAIVMLSCGIVLLAAAVTQYQQAASELARSEAVLLGRQRADKKNVTRSQAMPKLAAERTREMAAARRVMQQLALPWDALFLNLELATEKDIALLAIEPDAKKMRITLIAEASSLQGMLNYVRRLQALALFSDVILQKHEVQLKDPDRPLRFTLTGHWGERP